MSFNVSLFSTLRNFTSGILPKTQGVQRVFARVIDVCSDETHPDYEKFGKTLALNGIRYKPLNSSQEEDPENTPFAYSSQVDFVRVPVVNEIVEVFSGPSNSIAESSYKAANFYSSIHSLWNNAHHNASPDLIFSSEEITIGTGIQESPSVKTLQPFTGDTYIQGRLGQSLRFAGFSHPDSTITSETDNGKPVTILRVKHETENSELNTTVENVNLDDSSIYLTSDHIVPLQASSTKQDTYRENPPSALDSFKGKQIIIDSGRIVLHTSSDHLLLNSKLSIGLSGNTLNLDSREYISIDSPSIFLGSEAKEPVLKGDTAVKLLEDILSALSSLVTTHSLATPATAHVQLIAGSQGILPKIQSFKTRLQSLKSKKVFTE